MITLERAYRRYPERGFRIVGINIYQSREEAEEFVRDVGITFPMLLDRTGTTVDEYTIYFIPVSCIVAPSGTVLDVYAGNPTEDEIQEVVERYWR